MSPYNAMNQNHDIWLKAAVIGSLWGASEIVLGSFLHNLRVPFSGNILTAIGIILMVAGHRLWPERGILFRAGLICAALKTLSPSPIILGPMLSIFMQASLMEMSVLVGRKSNLSYVIGGGLAVSWNLLYRILSTIILYGSSLIALYQNLIDYLAAQTSIQLQSYWIPILILWMIFFTWGAFAGIAGIMISRAASNAKNQLTIASRPPANDPVAGLPRSPNPWSLVRPISILILLIAGLYSISMLSFYPALIVLTGYLVLVWLYNRRLLLRFAKKRGFWLALAIMISLSGIFMGSANGFSPEGLMVGVEMGMRAIYVISGFGIISNELQKPQIAGLFRGKTMAPFFSALQLAFQTTPLLIETIPGKQAWRRPARVLAGMVGSMEYSLEYMRRQYQKNKAGIIITGPKGSGKSTLTAQVIRLLKDRGVEPAGILAPAYFENDHRIGYMVQSVENGSEHLLCKRTEQPTDNLPGRYKFDPGGLRFGEALLSAEKLAGKDVLIIDELGPFELRGMGWDNVLRDLLPGWQGTVIAVIRESLVEEITRKYDIDVRHVYHAGEACAESIADAVQSNQEKVVI
ncbi:MAG: hypothetical protein EA394_06795 [Bacteroidia bacterium]|nr:MAG: hypothetical protein EA394_06795 [Bacteroidia bacterium]